MIEQRQCQPLKVSVYTVNFYLISATLRGNWSLLLQKRPMVPMLARMVFHFSEKGTTKLKAPTSLAEGILGDGTQLTGNPPQTRRKTQVITGTSLLATIQEYSQDNLMALPNF